MSGIRYQVGTYVAPVRCTIDTAVVWDARKDVFFSRVGSFACMVLGLLLKVPDYPGIVLKISDDIRWKRVWY